MSQDNNRKFYPGLNELRAIAALSILPGHIEQIKQIYNFKSLYFPVSGKWGVVLFFVISGFLITTLLLEEKKTKKHYKFKKFLY